MNEHQCAGTIQECPYLQARRAWTHHPAVIVGVIVSILMQFATTVWWASAISTRVEKLESGEQIMQQRADHLTERIEQKLDSIQQSLLDHEQRTMQMYQKQKQESQ